MAVAGHSGDVAVARRGLGDPDPAVRAAALGALCRAGPLEAGDLVAALCDPVPSVRRRACQLVPRCLPGGAAAPPASTLAAALARALDDADGPVCEAACYALGELPPATVGRAITDALASTAREHVQPLCREAAVAALGSLGAPAGLPAVLAAMGDRPAVRRRAAVALAAFEGAEVDSALEKACQDRDWQVRQVAEDLLGRRRRPGTTG